MPDFPSIKANAFHNTTMAREYCRCCYSAKNLKKLSSPALDVYLFICNSQGFDNGDIEIETCPKCCEFLKEVHRFRIKCHAVDEIFRNNLNVDDFDVESILRKAIDEKSSLLDVKEEVIEIFDECDIQIDKVEVDSDKENTEEVVSERPLVSNQPEAETSLECDNMYDHQKSSLLIPIQSCDVESYQTYETAVNPNAHEKPLNYHNKHFKCDKCNYRTNIKQNLTKHQRRHFIGCHKPFKCPECTYSTMTLYQLKFHMAEHYEDKPYKCSKCAYCSRTSILLKKHTLSKHSVDKPFKCTECSYATITAEKLKIHTMRRHRNERPFACDLCSYRAKFKYDMKSHLRIHTIKNAFKCSQCDFITDTNEKLINHTTNVHLNEKDQPERD